MAKFSEALARVHQVAHDHVVRSKDISRADRESLVRSHWLKPIVRGWYLLIRPDVSEGESSSWYASFWNFLGLYLSEFYGSQYCLSAESSLDLHVDSTTVPKQVIAIAKKGNNTPLELPFGTSLLTYKDPENITDEKVRLKGVQAMSLPLALCRVGPSYFTRNGKDAEIALRLIQDPSDWIRVLLKYDFKRAANRIVGAYQFLGEEEMAKQIRSYLT